MDLIAFTHVLGNKPGARIGKVRFYETGYYTTGFDNSSYSEKEVDQEVAELNAAIGVPEDVAESAANGSIFGWHTPAAQKAIEFFKQKSLEGVGAE